MVKSGMTLDTSDFDRSIEDTLNSVSKRKRKFLEDSGKLLVSTQRVILRAKVVNWTGRLSASIKAVITKDTVTVGGNTGYAAYIEEGDKSFLGFWYMRDSLKIARPGIVRMLKDIVK